MEESSPSLISLLFNMYGPFFNVIFLPLVILLTCFSAQETQPNWTGPITTGPSMCSNCQALDQPTSISANLYKDDYVIAINMSASWDWKTNISEVVINKTAAIETDNLPPNVQSGAFFQGPTNDPQVYLYGGVTPSINQSFPYWQWPTTNQYTLYVIPFARKCMNLYTL